MLRMITYGDYTENGTSMKGANSILGVSRTPKDRCIWREDAINCKASETDMIAWEKKQIGQTFPYNRLVPVAAIKYDDPDNPFSELYDDQVAQFKDERVEFYDSWKAGYTYQVTNIEFKSGSDVNNVGNGAPTNIVNNGDGTTTYSRGWVSVTLKDDDGTHAKVSYPLPFDEWCLDYNVMASGYYFITSDGYANVGTCVHYVDTLGAITDGSKRIAYITIKATPIDDLINAQATPTNLTNSSTGETKTTTFKCVKPLNTNTEFVITLHHGSIEENSILEYDYNSTNSITLSNNHSSDSLLDIAVILPGLSTNGAYWDSNGYHSATTSDLSGAVSISKSSNSTSVNLDWANVIKPSLENAGSAIGLSFYIYGCWDTMHISNDHLQGSSGNSVTIGGTSSSFNVTAAGNLNKTEEESSIRNYYTCMYKVTYHTGDEKILVQELNDADSAYTNTGVYGIIYPEGSNFSYKVYEGDSTYNYRSYVGAENLVQNKQATVSILSTINSSPASFVITKTTEFSGTVTDTDSYTINGQTLNNDNSITINPSSSSTNISIDFSSVSTDTGARWLKFKQEGSNEYANVSFTFNP